MAKIILNFYKNDDGFMWLKIINKRLTDLGHDVIYNFNINECLIRDDKVVTKNNDILSDAHIIFNMNADERTPYSENLIRILNKVYDVKIINNIESYLNCADKPTTNLLLKNAGINVPEILHLSLNSLNTKEVSNFFKAHQTAVLKPRTGGGR